MVHHDPGAGKRLDGWKSIAAYFNRDRTTVMRWARERGLPIRRMPGGKQGSVFALEHELAAWALRQDDIAAPEVSPGEEAQPASPVPRRDRRIGILIAATALLLAVLGGGAWWWTRPAAPRPLAMPADPAVARDYVAARDAWARRTPADLDRAIRLYDGVIRRAPGFAPARAGLAEAWLILREYGEADEATAYRNARRQVAAAFRLDADLPSAHRAMGFIDYWWDGKPASATAHFRRALALDDRDAQTHFWFANMLADLGQDAAAQAEYDKARLLDPGSRVIEVEQACSHWQAGRDALALQQLTALARRAPEDATIRNCLAWVHISRGDIVGFTRALSERARLRREPRLLRLAARMEEAVRRDPAGAVRVLVAEGRREIAAGERKLRETPAFYASAMGDRATLVQLLTEASDLGERWPSVPVTHRIAARWRGDAQVQRLLRRVAVPRA
ncbi:tetratricopeptide repeat protein [Sphingomonas corticis]|jgi:tetratricopeptide (TPR) repeat protein|uniref:Tetratricopeptide repeat protein n=1 Tax=Sphingomonas corticis TaxID=2722791 RepID=A0ABX1CKN0_9SPHN|nr:tetratricopeptide repeat protein [Sphingomonas corticis]NJR78540.1 tetratricopeptide repeat protein [Sphingomonas corticis]